MNIIDLLEDLRKIYNHKLNSKTMTSGLFTSEMKVISIDIINKNIYQSIEDEISEFNKIYVKNQETDESVCIDVKELESYSLNKDNILFKTKEGEFKIDLGFSLN